MANETKSTRTLPPVALLLDSARGTFIPKNFVEGFDLEPWGLDPASWAVETCRNIDYDGYWDAWDSILDTAKFVEDGHVWTLYQDGDLWALCPELMTTEELENFGFDGEMVEERKCQELIAELKDHPGVSRYPEHTLYGRLGDTWILDDTVHGDYCGGYVQMANYEVLNQAHGHYLQTRHEGYGSTMLLFTDNDIKDATSDELKSLIESLDSLQGYPVLDEERLSKLEFEAGEENWESWGRSDFKKALLENAADCYEEQLENFSDDQLDEAFNAAQEYCGEYWRQDGEGLTMYIDIDRCAQAWLDHHGMSAVE